METDTLILGAGISGLRCGIEILHKRPKTTVVILEKYKYKGGRVVTYKKTLSDIKGRCSQLQWENGAGRIHISHTKVLELVKRYNLSTFPLSDEVSLVDKGELKPNTFETLLTLFLPSLEQFEPSILASHTMRELFRILLKERTDDFLLQFPYRAEVDTLRADLAIQSFKREMGTYQGYVIVKEGLSTLIDGMVKEFISLGGTIFTQQTVVDVLKEKETYLVKTTTPAGDVVWEGKEVISTLHCTALKELPCFQSWDLLKSLTMEPLVRVYAVFPTKNNRSWFSDIGKCVCTGPIRYFIPIDPSCGVVMLSYTDGKDARRVEAILEKGEEALEDFLMTEIRKDFPTYTIPDPLFFKSHPWSEGCSYWLPGDYRPEEYSRKSLQPFPDTMPKLYFCGESFALRQAWMEGALEQTDLLLQKIL